MSPSKTAKSIHLPINGNLLLEQLLVKVNDDARIRSLWHVVNVNAMKRLGITDHGPTHFQIVADISLRLLRLLIDAGVKPSITKEFGLSADHAELVVVLASLLHDIGMTINRQGHEEFSLFLAAPLLEQLLSDLPINEQVIVSSEVLHAIISHRRSGAPITVEGGIVRVADALDMAQGRSRIPYEAGKIDIHSVSAMAIDEITIKKGRTAPIEVSISMNHTAGIFQIDELLKEKIRGSGLEEFVTVKVYMDKGHGKQLFRDFLIKK